MRRFGVLLASAGFGAALVASGPAPRSGWFWWRPWLAVLVGAASMVEVLAAATWADGAAAVSAGAWP